MHCPLYTQTVTARHRITIKITINLAPAHSLGNQGLGHWSAAMVALDV
jgi:hypothetical protein